MTPPPHTEKKKKKKKAEGRLTAKYQIGCLRSILYLTSSYFKDKSEASELLEFNLGI